MKYDFFGSNENGWHCSIKYESGIDEELEPCPFCGSTVVDIHNTHSPSYWAQCECSAQIDSNDDQDDSEYSAKESCKKAHKNAFKSAIDNWNTRE